MPTPLTDQTQFSNKVQECLHLRDFYRKLSKKSSSYSIKVSEKLKLDIDIVYKDCKKVLFVFSGAKKNSLVTVPFFTGKKIVSELNCTIIYISDPSLYLDDELLLSWYAGCKEFKTQIQMLKIINKLKEYFSFDQLFFFGGSGGGWASLYFSSFFNKSVALVFNPQTNIVNYSAGSYRVVEKFSNLSWGCDRENLVNYIDTDLRKIYKKNINNYIVYMQNISDSHAIRDLKPFCEHFGFKYENELYSGMVCRNFYLHLTDWSEGHKPPPYLSLKYILENVIHYFDDFKESELRNKFIAAEELALKDKK